MSVRASERPSALERAFNSGCVCHCTALHWRVRAVHLLHNGGRRWLRRSAARGARVARDVRLEAAAAALAEVIGTADLILWIHGLNLAAYSHTHTQQRTEAGEQSGRQRAANGITTLVGRRRATENCSRGLLWPPNSRNRLNSSLLFSLWKLLLLRRVC